MTHDVTPAANPAGHPMDTVLKRIFKDPTATLEGELKMIGDAQKRLEQRRLEAKAVPRTPAQHAAQKTDRLVDLARAAELFHTPDGVAFADVTVDGHRETWAVDGRDFHRWLTRSFLDAERRLPAAEAVRDAIRTAEIEALAGSPERSVHLRVGGLDGRLYLDLGDAAWRVAEIDSKGWRIVDKPPLRFRRPPRLRALPAPEPGGSIDTLRNFLNVRCDEDLVVVVAWMLAALRDRGPCPVLVLAGEPGSAKSTCTAMLQALIDPSAQRLRALPGDERALLAACQDAHLLTFDNLSAVPPWCADALCRLVSAGSAAASSAGGNGDASAVGRPVILNGIGDLVARPDLAERALFLTLPGIADIDRRPETELWAAFEHERGRLLGVLLTALSEGLRRLSAPRPAKLPRMADFALWAMACETALWPAGTFRSAYAANVDGAAHDIFESDPVALALLHFMADQRRWEGTAAGLQRELTRRSRVGTRNWPVNARALAGRLRQLAGPLRSKLDLDVAFLRHSSTRVRLIRLTAAEPLSQRLGFKIRVDGGPPPAANHPPGRTS